MSFEICPQYSQSSILLEGMFITVTMKFFESLAIPQEPDSCFLILDFLILASQVMTQADLGVADAYINGDFSFVDQDSGLLNLIMVHNITI